MNQSMNTHNGTQQSFDIQKLSQLLLSRSLQNVTANVQASQQNKQFPSQPNQQISQSEQPQQQTQNNNTQPLVLPQQLVNDKIMNLLKQRQALQGMLSQRLQQIPKDKIPNLILPQQKPSEGSMQPNMQGAKPLRQQIHEVINFIINSDETMKKSEIDRFKLGLIHNPKLLEVYELLILKYKDSTKTKENIIKYILRKVFKWMKEKIMKEDSCDSKTACKNFVERYFPASKEGFKNSEINFNDDEALFDALMPFKKNSKNKTMNSSFLADTFSSKAFRDDYCLFLNSFDDTMYADNFQKIERFLTFIEECIEKNNVRDVVNFKRLPWKNSWIEKTKQQASDLINSYKRGISKKIEYKIEDSDDTIIVKKEKSSKPQKAQPKSQLDLVLTQLKKRNDKSDLIKIEQESLRKQVKTEDTGNHNMIHIYGNNDTDISTQK